LEKAIKKATKELNSLLSEKRLIQAEMTRHRYEEIERPANTKNLFEFWAKFESN